MMMRTGGSASDVIAGVATRLFDYDRGDQDVFDALDLDGQLPDVEMLAGRRHASDLAHDELAHGDLTGGPCPFDPDPRALERQVAGKAHAAVAEAQREQARRLELVGNAPEKLAEHVLERD